MPDSAHFPRVGVAVADDALRTQLPRWLFDERMRAVDDVDAADLTAVLVDAATWPALRDSAAHRRVPWIVLGAAEDWQWRLQALRDGAGLFVGAPVTRDGVLRALRAAGVEPGAIPPKVLLAGPDDTAGRVHAAALRAAGFDVHEVREPPVLCAAIARAEVDVVVLREGLPGASATDLMHLLRADAAHDGVMLLAIVGGPQQMHSLPAGASVLLEPVDAPALCAAVGDRALRRRRWVAAGAALQRMLAMHEQERCALDAHALVSVTDAQGRIVYANDHFCTTSGYTRDELVGRNHRIVKSGVHPPDFYAEMWRTISAGHVWQGELCNRRKDGQRYWVTTTIMPIRADDGRTRQYLSIRTEITAQKQAQFALAQQLERLEQMSRLARVGSWALDADTQRVHWSDETYRIHGLAIGSEIDLDRAIAHYDGNDARQIVRSSVQAALRDGQPIEFELPLRTADGERRWVRVIGKAERENGRVVRLSGAIQDVTAFKQAALALQAARDEADRANQAKSEFLSMMSHELRTPMNAVLGFGQLLELDIPVASPSHAHVQEILRGGRHLLALIDDVLDLARIDSGRLVLSPEHVGLSEIVHDVLRLAQPLAARRHIGLRVDVDDTLAVHADRLRLRQVLMNLLSNAIKYNVEGGRVGIHARRGEAGHVRVEVTDTGPGIPPDRQGELFQPFQRLGAERGPIEGTGIGLAIVRRLVEHMHGRVGVDSAPGRGSTFWFELPGSDEATSDSGWGHSALATLPSMPDRRVLYVDDNPSNLRLVEKIFERWPGIALLTAQDPGVGLELALAHLPDLILLDLQMAPLNGFKLLARVRQEPGLRAVPVIAITADAMRRTVEQVREAGFDAMLTKPFDVRAFIATVERALRREGDTA
ncbi:ATP-binding protein [Azohydromonas sediminis]|uniref:ATP-binding protein n=1 Tax=Azohydromonas sediminis TaxID=2259674 RepID=UPI0013C2C5C9|nr:ATP-binding protein [Azohydromonas sediminis]